MNCKMTNSELLNHPQLKDILMAVKNMKLEGVAIQKIANALSRNFEPPTPYRHAWESSFVIQLLEILRKSGELPPSALQVGKIGRVYYHGALLKVRKERELRPNR